MTNFLYSAWLTTVELAPWLLLGALVAGVLHVLLPENFVERQLSGRWSVLKAVTLGVPLPLCSCGVIPMAMSLRKSRASRGATVGFLISTPQTGVDSMLVSAAMLGWPFALFKVAAALVTGVVGGWITGIVDPDKQNLEVLEQVGVRSDKKKAWLIDLTAHTLEILQSIWGWLVVGIIVSALINTFVPNEAFAGLAAYGSVAAMGVALGLSLPLYVCATASVPIAAALVHNGLPTGAALVFLMAGPATNVATIGAVYRTLGTKSLAVYLTTIIVGSIAGGLLFDWLLATSAVGHHDTPHPTTWWGATSAVVLLTLITCFATQKVARWWRHTGTTAAHAGETTTTLEVEGMSCQNCANSIEQRLQSDPSVRVARVTLDPPQATVVGDADENMVRSLISQAGYRVPPR